MALAFKLIEPVTDEALLRLSSLNDPMQLERSASGAILVRPPTGGKGGELNAALGAFLFNWNKAHGGGHVFDSSTGFKLPDTSVLSPDASWVDAISWNALPKAAREGYPPLCPRIVFEILSPTDSVHELRQKLATFLENGVAVGILLNPRTRAAERFETGMPIVTIAANEVLVIEKRFFPGATDDFKLDLAELFGV